MCRVGFVETARAIGMAAGASVVRGFAQAWPAFAVVEVDQDFAERAASLAFAGGLRSRRRNVRVGPYRRRDR